MIKLNATPTVRECKAPYEYEDGNGKLVTKEIRVRYFSRTVAQLKRMQAAAKARAEDDPDAIVWLSDSLLERIESLPDIEGPDGQPLAITIENLDLLDTKNLKAIGDAIDADLVPKEQPSK